MQSCTTQYSLKLICTLRFVLGYYWRDYNKDIPDDALPGGKDKRGKTTYIGQTVHGSCNSGIVVTGHIYEAEKQLKYEWGYRQQLAKNSVQVLVKKLYQSEFITITLLDTLHSASRTF